MSGFRRRFKTRPQRRRPSFDCPPLCARKGTPIHRLRAGWLPARQPTAPRQHMISHVGAAPKYIISTSIVQQLQPERASGSA